MGKVIFICVGNSCRSQMAEAWFNHLCDKGWVAESAGTNPADSVSSKAIEVMKEVGIDLSKKKPKGLDTEIVLSADKVITMGCIKDCLITTAEKTVDWGIDDPMGKPIEEYRKARDEIRGKVESLIEPLS